MTLEKIKEWSLDERGATVKSRSVEFFGRSPNHLCHNNSKLSGKLRMSHEILLTFCALLLFFSNAFSQTMSGTYSYDRKPDETKCLLELLKCNKTLNKVPKCFYGEAYDKKLSELIVFIDKTHSKTDPKKHEYLTNDKSAIFALVQGGVRRQALFGEKYIYILVFVAENYGDETSVGRRIRDYTTSEKITSKGNNETTQETTKTLEERWPLSVHYSSIASSRGSGEFFLISIIQTIVDLFSGVPMEKADNAGGTQGTPDNAGEPLGKAANAAEKTRATLNTPLRMQRVGTNDDTNLFFEYVKVKIPENCILRFTVQEDYNAKGDDEAKRSEDYYHIATFGNYSGSWITSSIGLMGTFVRPANTADKRFPVDPFMFAHFYIKRPQVPAPHYQRHTMHSYLKQLSVSLVAGTKISKSPFDDLFIGVGLGHILSTTGLVVGLNFRTMTTPIPNPLWQATQRKAHWCLGYTFLF